MDNDRNDLEAHRHSMAAEWTGGALIAFALLGIVIANAGEAPREPPTSHSKQAYRPYASIDNGLTRSKQVFDERRARFEGLPAEKAGINLARESMTTED
jgi:hypothetical protein